MGNPNATKQAEAKIQKYDTTTLFALGFNKHFSYKIYFVMKNLHKSALL